MARFPINVSNYVMGLLKSLAVSPDESYESILSRLLDCKCDALCYEYCLDNGYGVYIKCVIDWGSPVENVHFLDDGEWVDSFPLSCDGVDNNVWLDFRDLVLGCDDFFSVLSFLEVNEFAVVNGLSVGRLK